MNQFLSSNASTFTAQLVTFMTTPNPPKLFSSLEELVQQDRIGFFTEYGSRTLNIGKDDPPHTNLRFQEVFQVLQSNHLNFRLLHDGLETRPGSCARNVDSIRKGYACLGEELNMLGAISEDFRKTEQCNYYIFPSQISTLQYAMAFRVSLKQQCIIFLY